MLTVQQTNVLAYVDTRPSNSSTLPEVAFLLSLPEADALLVIRPLIDAGTMTYDAASGQIVLTKAEGAWAAETDPSIDPDVTDALNKLFADVEGSLSTFLASLNAAGLSGDDARLGVYVARQLALGVAAKRGDDRLRAPLVKAAALLGALSEALGPN